MLRKSDCGNAPPLAAVADDDTATEALKALQDAEMIIFDHFIAIHRTIGREAACDLLYGLNEAIGDIHEARGAAA